MLYRHARQCLPVNDIMRRFISSAGLPLDYLIITCESIWFDWISLRPQHLPDINTVLWLSMFSNSRLQTILRPAHALTLVSWTTCHVTLESFAWTVWKRQLTIVIYRCWCSIRWRAGLFGILVGIIGIYDSSAALLQFLHAVRTAGANFCP